MNHYTVTWEIGIEADSPQEAAEKALRIHRDTESIATVFEVKRHLGGPVIETTIVDLSPEV